MLSFASVFNLDFYIGKAFSVGIFILEEVLVEFDFFHFKNS